VSVTVIPSPTVTLLPISTLCKNDAAIVLQGNPSGGVYSGTGVSGSNFNPSASGSGTFGVKYSYTATNACADTAVTSIVVSECTGIYPSAFKNEVLIYPNPSAGPFLVSAPNEIILSIKITDFSGKVVFYKEGELKQQALINLQANDSGMYLIEVILADRILHARVLLNE
jgi:hypothetical protein